MSGYIKFTQDEKDRARFTDLPTFLQNQGEEIKKRGSAYEWLDGSQKEVQRMNGLTARKKSVSTAVCGFISMTDRAAMLFSLCRDFTAKAIPKRCKCCWAAVAVR